MLVSRHPDLAAPAAVPGSTDDRWLAAGQTWLLSALQILILSCDAKPRPIRLSELARCPAGPEIRSRSDSAHPVVDDRETGTGRRLETASADALSSGAGQDGLW